ncbi:MAG: (Fe-S)-binding protein [Candidatus Krumholzibacteriota bacterium]|nr:(Fe-S)-binding protein [Candidatus Krumholzibacteriota bacterium]
MSDKREIIDVTEDILRCNRCGKCISVCPVYDVFHEEWASARGKVELAEAFFRNDELDEKNFQKVFDLCLHCMECRENCPSGMRAHEVVMAVRAEMARRGLIPKIKTAVLRMIEDMNSSVFGVMRRLGLVRRSSLHGYSRSGPLGFLFPLFGWRKDRTVPLPASKPFLDTNPEFFPASRLDGILPLPEQLYDLEIDIGDGVDRGKVAALVAMIAAARSRNLENSTRIYFYIGHTVNQFFPEEAEKGIWLLNLIGVDVEVPKDQLCCGAPYFYSGDIENAHRVAKGVIDRFSGHSYDWIVTTCASGGLMLKEEFPRIFDISSDGFFRIEWDPESDLFIRRKETGTPAAEYGETARLYKKNIEGRVKDLNELIADLLVLEKDQEGSGDIFSGKKAQAGGPSPGEQFPSGPALPVVTYHHPCHLNRGQDVNWQPEAILELLFRYRYIKMADSARCCGGGGSFTFAHSEASEKIASKKADAIEAVDPYIVATSCPLCRIQLADTIRRRFVLEADELGIRKKMIPVSSPAELLADDLASIIGALGKL